MPPSEIPTQHHQTLEQYRAALPGREYLALEAWLSTFYPFQLDWLLDLSDYAVCNKSRQIGMSHTTAAWGVLYGAFHGELTTIISVGDRESAEVLEKAKGHRDVLCALGSQMAGRRGKDNASEVDFKSGGRIMALPSSGGRSFTGNVFLDEFAYQQHAAAVWDAALAVTMHGFRARVASTPNGIGNDFEQLWSNPTKNAGWSKHEISLQRALAEGMRVDIDRCWKMAKGDPRLFDQLFGCKFLDGELQYIPGELIEVASLADYDAKGEGLYFAGLDIGKTVDLTVLVVVKKIGGVLFVVYVESCKRTDSDGLAAMVARAFTRFGLRKLAVDATGLGVFPAEQIQKKHGSSKVEPVVFGQQTKEDMATGLYTAFAERKLRLPKTRFPEEGCKLDDVPAMRSDVASIRRIITSAGNVRYDAPHTDQGHADRAWALALAVHVAASARTYATV